MSDRPTRLSNLVDAAARASKTTSSRFHEASMRNVTILAFALAIAGVVWGFIQGWSPSIVIGVASIFLGVVSGWAQLTFVMNQQLDHTASRERVVSVVMIVVSIVVTIAGVVMLFSGFLEPSAILFGALAGIIMIAAVSLIVAPWWITLVANLGSQEASTAREQLRLDFTARLHDSVLQTLALIQLNAHDSKKVAALAHAQERDLREWLYGESDAAPTDEAHQPGSSDEKETFVAALKRIVAEVEDSSQSSIEVVTVGDTPATNRLNPILAAAREAMRNATHHGNPPVTVYEEASPHLLQVFVRDHGEGFDADRLPTGRMGVSESIVGRMRQAGGTADIVSRPEWGTEVRLSMPLNTEPLQGERKAEYE